MILTGREIEKQHQNGTIIIEPFDGSQITTNSYDLRLGCRIARYNDAIIDPRHPPDVSYMDYASNDTISLKAGDFVLGHSVERVGSTSYVPIIHARSGVARLGVFVHITADLIDIGSIGQITFQIYCTMDVVLLPGMKIGQVSFWVPKGDIVPYSGKYQNSIGPRPSEIYRDFLNDTNLKLSI